MNKSTIISDIMEALKEAFPEVKHIDKDWGQLSMEQPPVGWPCILTDIEEVEIQDLTDLNERATVTLVLTVANKRTVSSSGNAPRAFKERSMETLDLTDRIHRLMQGFAPEGAEYYPLQVVSFYKVNDLPGAEVYAMRYRTRYNINLESDE